MSVYTRVTKEALIHFLEHYNIGEVTSFTGITTGMENTNYALDINSCKSIFSKNRALRLRSGCYSVA